MRLKHAGLLVGALYVVALASDIWLADKFDVEPGWLSAVDVGLSLPFIAAITLGPAFLLALAVWRLVFGGRRLGVPSGAALFIVGSASSCGFYGHAGPVPVLMWIQAVDDRRGSIIWMATTGLLVTGLLAWWSRRPHAGGDK